MADGASAVRSFADAVRAASTSPSRRWELERALAFPWAWPGVEALGDLVELAATPAPLPPKPGEVLLVSATPGERAALWALSPSPRSDARPLVDRAARDARAALRIAASMLPLVATVSPLRSAPAWCARLVAKVGTGTDRVLDGPSFGLGFVLAAASMLLDVAVPESVCALGEVDELGRVLPVGALGDKLHMIAAWAPAVRTLLVVGAQAARARELVEASGADLVVRAVDSVAEALAAIFPAADTEPALRWADPSRLRAALDDVLRMTIEGTPWLLDWNVVARAAARLGEHPEITADPPAHAQARLAEAIASRHAARPVLLEWPVADVLRRYPRPVRLRLLAHVVQSAADAPDADISTLVRNALAHVATAGEEHAEDLELLGAVGRALAAADRPEDAIAPLRRSVEGWLAIWRADGASHSLCELLRLHGVLGDAGSVAEARSRWIPAVLDDPRTGHVSRAFVHLAAGRALALVGSPAAALEHLEAPLDWATTPAHVRFSRLRWSACSLAACGREREADLLRDELALGGAGTPYPALAELDAALAAHRDPAPALAALGQVAEGELRRWSTPGLSAADLGHRVATRWRY